MAKSSGKDADMHEQENDPARVWKMMKKVTTCMFTTRDGEALDARPLHAYVETDEGIVRFMTGSDSAVVEQVGKAPRVLMNFAGGDDFAAVEGSAVVNNDRAKIKELWNPWAEAFWDGPDDPRVRLIDVRPDHARYWDAPNAVVSTVQMLAAAVTGKEPKMGKSGDVRM